MGDARGRRLMSESTPQASNLPSLYPSAVNPSFQQARIVLEAAQGQETPAQQFRVALAAADILARVVVARYRMVTGHPVDDIWRLLSRLAPELGEWAGYFSLCQARMSVRGPFRVSAREADDLVRDVYQFSGIISRGVDRGDARRGRGSA